MLNNNTQKLLMSFSTSKLFNNEDNKQDFENQKEVESKINIGLDINAYKEIKKLEETFNKQTLGIFLNIFM